jgi:dCTP deaminase
MGMTLMGDAALGKALASRGIVIDPAPDMIKSASIDLRLGPEAFLGTGSEILPMEQQRLLTIPPGELAIVSTLERLTVGARYAGQIGLRSAFARKGLALLAGPQIDPGFRGRLHVALVNLSPVEIAISYREPLVTVVFHDLGSDVTHPYGESPGDEYHQQDAITGAEINDIRQHRGYAMSEVIREMANLSANVGQLRSSVDGYIRTSASQAKRTEAYLGIFVAAVVALVVAMLVQILG